MSKVWIRFCMYDAHDLGVTEHPQKAILRTYPGATNMCPESIADAWFFRAVPRPAPTPPFSLAPGYACTPVAQASIKEEP